MQRIIIVASLFIMATLASCNLLSKDKSTKNKGSLQIKKDSYCEKNRGSTKSLKVKMTGNLNDFIIPDSNTKIITTSVLDTLDNSQLDYARNEIYARHGYEFTIKKYKDYFGKKWWYDKVTNFSEDDFNEIEKANLKTIDEYVNSVSKLVREVNDNYIKFDLNGDKKDDIVTLEFQESSKKFILNINNTFIKQDGENFRDTMFLYDIDNNDKFLEVAVVDERSKGKYTSFYSYNGSKIKLIGTIAGADDLIKIRGTGQLETKDDSKILVGWKYTLLYSLNPQNRELTCKPAALYKINSKVKLKENITIQTTKTNPNHTFELGKGKEITLVGTDNIEWVSIKDSKGKLGWLKFAEANKINQKDSSEIFEKVADGSF